MQKKNKKSKKVKIMATVGPSSFEESIIQKMDKSGIDIFRINMSHIEIRDLNSIIKQLKKWTKKEICIDTEGSQIRTGVFTPHQKAPSSCLGMKVQSRKAFGAGFRSAP